MTVAQHVPAAHHIPTTQQVAGAVLAGLGGVCLALQGRINGQLGHILHDGILAALISTAIGLILLFAAVFAIRESRRGVRRLTAGLRSRRLRWWECLGGFCGGFIVACQGITIATIGVAVFTVAAVSGYVLASLFVDRAGLGPGEAQPVTAPRAAGAALAMVAVVVAVSNKFGDPSSLWLAVLPALAGTGLAWQTAMNGLVRRETGNVFVSTMVNFSAAGVILLVGWLVYLVVQGWPAALPGDWWLYLGGPLGICAVGTAVFAVRLIGVLVLGLASVAGQLLGAIVLDVVAPTAGGGLSIQGVLGAAITMVAVGVAALKFRGRSERMAT